MMSRYEELEELFEEACIVLDNTLSENRLLREEQVFLYDFIEWKSLSEEFELFKENAGKR